MFAFFDRAPIQPPAQPPPPQPVNNQPPSLCLATSHQFFLNLGSSIFTVMGKIPSEYVMSNSSKFIFGGGSLIGMGAICLHAINQYNIDNDLTGLFSSAAGVITTALVAGFTPIAPLSIAGSIAYGTASTMLIRVSSKIISYAWPRLFADTAQQNNANLQQANGQQAGGPALNQV